MANASYTTAWMAGQTAPLSFDGAWVDRGDRWTQFSDTRSGVHYSVAPIRYKQADIRSVIDTVSDSFVVSHVPNPWQVS